jgi:hypothetical protein
MGQISVLAHQKHIDVKEVFLCLLKHHTMMMYGGSGGTALHLVNLGTRRE